LIKKINVLDFLSV